jgi:hypothetical protein
MLEAKVTKIEIQAIAKILDQLGERHLFLLGKTDAFSYYASHSMNIDELRDLSLDLTAETPNSLYLTGFISGLNDMIDILNGQKGSSFFRISIETQAQVDAVEFITNCRCDQETIVDNIRDKRAHIEQLLKEDPDGRMQPGASPRIWGDKFIDTLQSFLDGKLISSI